MGLLMGSLTYIMGMHGVDGIFLKQPQVRYWIDTTGKLHRKFGLAQQQACDLLTNNDLVCHLRTPHDEK